MNAAEKPSYFSTLEMAKVERRTLAAAVKNEIALGAAKAVAWDLSEVGVRDAKERRSGAVAANKPTDVRRFGDELLNKEAERECAAADVEAHKLRLKDLVAALGAAEIAVHAAARAVLTVEVNERAAALNAAIDHVLVLGEELRGLIHSPESTAVGAKSTVPPEATRALERVPKRNPYDIPLNELRGNLNSHVRSERLAALAADDDDSIDDDDVALVKKPRVEVGTHSRAADFLR